MTCYTAMLRSPARVPPLRNGPATDRPRRRRRGRLRALRRFAADYTCHQCGRAGNPHGHGRCAHCVLAERVNALLAGRDGAVSTQLEPLARHWRTLRLPFPAIRGSRRARTRSCSPGSAADGRPLSHDLLDELPPSRNQRYIRQLLVQTGVLPAATRTSNASPAGSITTSRTNRPRTRTWPARFCIGFCCDEHANGPPRAVIPTSADRDLRRRVSVALDFLAWIDEQGMALDRPAPRRSRSTGWTGATASAAT